MKTVKQSVILFHLLAWFFFWMLPIVFLMGHLGTMAFLPVLTSLKYWLFLIIYTSIFYLNAYWLLPQLFYKSRKLLYFIVVLLMLVAIGVSKPFDKIVTAVSKKVFETLQLPPQQDFIVIQPYRPVPPNNAELSEMLRPQFDIISIMIYILVLGLGYALQASIRWRHEIEKKAAAETEKAHAELKFLKAQVNPHFLFNSLNNIYSLALLKDENTADSIMQLSNIMRYITDESTNDFVPLTKEVECINSYINLQKLRLGKQTGITFEVCGTLMGKLIAPIILLGFVENIFKYGISKHEPSPVIIQLKADDKSIEFFCQNKIFKHLQKDKRIGTGIINIQKRLAYLYPNKHVLNVSTENQLYTLELKLAT